MSASSSGDEEVVHAERRVGMTLRGKWRLDSLIGIGGMAAVYAATHKLGRRDAIKILHPQMAVSKELCARFEQEARAVIRLGHPGTVQVLDVDVSDDGAPFMVMEFLEGESLGQRAFRLGGLDERELFGYAERLLDVLAAAHSQGIIHRDIKPDNLFVTTDGRLKVLDFGIARMLEGGGKVHTRTGAMLGTTAYMAPEQIHAQPIDGRADLFAVGATLFRILAKRRIHDAESDVQLLMKMGSTPAPPLRTVMPQVSLGVARVVDRALSFDRDRRYPDATTMQADVRAVLNGQDPPFATRLAMVPEAVTRAEGRPESSTPSQNLEGAPPIGVGGALPFGRLEAGSPASADMTAAAWGGQPEPTGVKKAPIATLLVVGALMLAIGGGATMFVLSGGEKWSGEKQHAKHDEESDEEESEPQKPRGSVSAGEAATATKLSESQPQPAAPETAVASASALRPPPSDAAPVPPKAPTRPPAKPTAVPTATASASVPAPKGRPGASSSAGSGKEKGKPKSDKKH